ncbi:MAG: hypothetical protein KDC87_22070, partial [Planctomycetes bacterium]|nr:hypothetical protein [Planctomycetota bacterium]
DPSSYDDALAMLRREGCRVTGWLPALSSDLLPELGGLLRLRDPETGREETLQVDGPLRAAMAEELRRLERAQDGAFDSAGASLVRFPVPARGDYRLRSWSADGLVYRV